MILTESRIDAEEKVCYRFQRIGRIATIRLRYDFSGSRKESHTYEATAPAEPDPSGC